PGSRGAFDEVFYFHPSPQLRAVGDEIFFVADDGVTGAELWRTDGTPGGTVLVKDISPGSGGSSPMWLTNVSGTLFFTTDDVMSGRELWRSDGTEAGTTIVKDIFLGAFTSFPSQLTDVDGVLFFTAFDQLWRSDGSSAGTVLVADIFPGAFPSELTNVGGRLFFTAFDGEHGEELWHSDGTPAGTGIVKDIFPGPGNAFFSRSFERTLTAVGGRLYFIADDGSTGRELWESDGTEAGTVRVRDVLPGPAGQESPP